MVNPARNIPIQPTASAAQAAPAFDAAALRNTALRSHRPVPHGEGVAQPYDLSSASLQSVTAMLAYWGTIDASRMLPVPQAGQPTLRVAAYEYQSDLPMEAWVDALPKDKKLKLNVVTCVSGHAGLPAAKFARENKYTLSVKGPDGKVQARQSFGPGYSNGAVEEYASRSPSIELDLSRPGNYVIDCAPDDPSSGVGGYIEARRLILHITGREPEMTVPAAGR